jgi:hypothetical protein
MVSPALRVSARGTFLEWPWEVREGEGLSPSCRAWGVVPVV